MWAGRLRKVDGGWYPSEVILVLEDDKNAMAVKEMKYDERKNKRKRKDIPHRNEKGEGGEIHRWWWEEVKGGLKFGFTGGQSYTTEAACLCQQS